jgi:hypothetical protein
MKTSLAAIQNDLKDAILKGADTFKAHIATPAKGSKSTAFGIYKTAYTMRLTDFLANDHEMLHSYLGDSNFAKLAEAYIKTNPSEHPNARWYSINLPAFLLGYEPLRRNPEIQELAALESALNTAFDAPEADTLTLVDLSSLDPEIFSTMALAIHPSTSRLKFYHNTTSIWSALKCEGQPPKPHLLDSKQEIAVWRQGTSSRFRLLGNEEAMALDVASKGGNFSQICEMIAVMEGAETAPQRAASYLRGWIEAELLLALPGFKLKAEK